MNNIIDNLLHANGAEAVRYLDISGFPDEQTLGLPRAVLFVMPLSKQFLLNPDASKIDEFLEKEKAVDALADELAAFLTQQGHESYSQSEANNIAAGYFEQAYADPDLICGLSPLPQKTLGRLAGLGFIGRNNLLVTEAYGCGFCMCSVLTSAPVETLRYDIKPIRCGNCSACVNTCPKNALKGPLWQKEGSREALVDVSRCACPLKCMLNCPWTIRYVKSNNNL